MRRAVRLLVVVAAVWSAYWLVAGYGLRAAVASWFEQRRDMGWQADYSEIATSGYPLRHVTRLSNPALADPATGTAWRSDTLRLSSPAIWPGQQTLRFADGPQRLSYYDQTATIDAHGMQAELHLKPGVALELERMALTSGAWTVARGNETLAAGDDLSLVMTQSAAPAIYDITATANGFSPGDGLRRLMRSAATLPQSLEVLDLNMTVGFDKVWDRSALEERRPQPVMIDLRLAELKWGALRLFATGEMEVDTQGIPTGELALKAENWREMVAMANAAGVLPDQAVDPITRGLGFLAGTGGNPNALDLRLDLRDGFVTLGPIPLGPAPRLILR